MTVFEREGLRRWNYGEGDNVGGRAYVRYWGDCGAELGNC
jgi:hypothetical protein